MLEVTRVTALILNYDYEDETRELASRLTNFPLQTVIIDNSQNEDLRQWTSARGISYVPTEGNIGYAGGNNRGIEMFLEDTDYFLILNPDISSITKDSINTLVDTLEQHPEVGILSPKLRMNDGNHLSNSSTLWSILRRLRVIPKTPTSSGDLRFCDFAQGGAMLIRSSVIESIGYFEESFFLYGEEIEYSLRARQNGFLVAVHDGVVVDHTNPTQLVSENIDYKVYYETRNRFLIGRLRFSGVNLVVYVLLTFLSIANESVRYARSGENEMVVPQLVGVWDGILGHFGRRRYLTN